ncbi:hypothetical protein GF360_03505 [candidate division WWE3 bacterium]|nr:hypothetical protein [candidate division WWE3 bacterium]
MIFQNEIKNVITKAGDTNPLYIRNLLKEEIQNYILNFVFTSTDYNELLFTGGTCLRKVYGLNRLSEDLDFDFLGSFDIEQFSKDVLTYFRSKVQYKTIDYSISGNRNTVYFKFPLLKELEFYEDRIPEDIFVRVDVSQETAGVYDTDKNLITAGKFQFFVTSYDLPTLFANKFVAFLNRSFFKGKFQKIPFKGRDVYDLYWFLQLSSKSSFELKMNIERLKVLLADKTLSKALEDFKEKVLVIDSEFLYKDLEPLLESPAVLEGFIDSYKEYLPKYIDFVV